METDDSEGTPPPLRRWRNARRALLTLGLLYCFWLGLGCAIQRNVLFPAHAARPVPNAGGGIANLEKGWLDTDEGRVEWWFAPPPGAQGPAPAVIFCHGNAELIDYQEGLVRRYHRMGVAVFMCEYRGYGRSAGSPSQAKITADLIKSYDQLVSRADVDPNRVFFHGRSVGTGAACALAAERKPEAIILESPFRSVAAMMAAYLIPRWFVLDPFDNETVLKTYGGPVLIFHGEDDRIIPADHSRALARIAGDVELVLYPGHGHNDIPITAPEHWEQIRKVLTKAKALPGLNP